MIRILFISTFILLTSCVHSQIPEDYYKSAKGLKGKELKTALHKIIRNHTEFEYTKGSPNVWEILKESDRDTVNSSNVILIYTGKSVDSDPKRGKVWNREHIWAKSHGNFGTKAGAGTDVHAIRPCNPKVNSARSNYDFAEGGSAYILSTTGEDTGCKFTSNSWEPRDEVKGDIARMIFYMATRYEGDYEADEEEILEPDLKLVDYVGSSPYPDKPPLHGKLSDLRKWHKQDPVDSMEIRRNNVIFKYQKNRNPFIDHPEYVDLIYDNLLSDKSDNLTKISNFYFVKAYPNPVKSFLIVELNDKFDINKEFELQVFDLLGKKRFSLKSNLKLNAINCSNLTKGMYLLKVLHKKSVISQQKFIVK